MAHHHLESNKDAATITLEGGGKGVVSTAPTTRTTSSGSVMDPGHARGLPKAFRLVANIGGGDSRDLNVDLTVADIAELRAVAGEIWYINIITVLVEDMGAALSLYGALTLTNGITVQQHGRPAIGAPDVLLFDLTEEGPVFSFSDYGIIGGEAEISSPGGAAADTQIVGFPFSTRNQRAVELDGDLDQRIEIGLSDNFSGLVKHRMSANGFRVIKADL